jgi:hypothetical protein
MSGPEDNPADDDPHHECQREVARLTARLAQAEALLRDAVSPHEFNCGWIEHPDFIKMIPVYKCTCGLDAFLASAPPNS